MVVLSLLTYALLSTGSRPAVTPTRPGAGVLEQYIGEANLGRIKEAAALETLSKVEIMDVTVSTEVSSVGTVETTFAKFTRTMAAKETSSPFDQLLQGLGTGNAYVKNRGSGAKIPIVCLHGFDSSCLEFRRMAPLLAEKGFSVLVPDILGWGFNPPSQDITAYDPAAKIEHLVNFVKQANGGEPVVVAGASLGGALACILAAKHPELVSKVVLIDAQGFIDGEGPSSLPVPLARVGVNVLKSQPLRMFANYIAYADKTFATVDAMRIGRLHCYMPTWEDASVSFLLSGGFSPSETVKDVMQDTLVLWGESDEILEPSTAAKFEETLPSSTIQWCKSGHVPHLEQPQQVADAIAQFLSKMS